MEISDMTGSEQSGQDPHRFRQVPALMIVIKISHGHSAHLNAQSSVRYFHDPPIDGSFAKVFIRLQVEDCGDSTTILQLLDFLSLLGKRPYIKVGKNLVIINHGSLVMTIPAPVSLRRNEKRFKGKSSSSSHREMVFKGLTILNPPSMARKLEDNVNLKLMIQ
jgi:hypothetical protein